jgi:hypothetical protein
MRLAIVDDDAERVPRIEAYFRERHAITEVVHFETLPEDGFPDFEFVSLDDRLGPYAAVHQKLRDLAVRSQGKAIPALFPDAQCVLLHSANDYGASQAWKVLTATLPGVRLVRHCVGNM